MSQSYKGEFKIKDVSQSYKGEFRIKMKHIKGGCYKGENVQFGVEETGVLRKTITVSMLIVIRMSMFSIGAMYKGEPLRVIRVSMLSLV